MNPAIARFDHYIIKLTTQASKAAIQVNPALTLYLDDARTSLFQLEGLCRLYAQMHDSKDFEKMGSKIKTLEDHLGKIDYYASFYKSLASLDEIPTSYKQYCFDQFLLACMHTNKLLKEEGWLDGVRIEKMKKRLKKLNWTKADQDSSLIKKAIKEELQEIDKFFKKVLNELDHIEEDIHEARRKLRWIGIYAQSLQGGIALHTNSKLDKVLKKYQTPDIISSQYNVLVPTPKDVNPVLFSKSHFFAVSYLIKSLGEWKDRGLKNYILVEAIQQLEILPEPLALDKVKTILGKNFQSDTEILNAAGSLLQQGLVDKILEGLILD